MNSLQYPAQGKTVRSEDTRFVLITPQKLLSFFDSLRHSRLFAKRCKCLERCRCQVNTSFPRAVYLLLGKNERGDRLHHSVGSRISGMQKREDGEDIVVDERWVSDLRTIEGVHYRRYVIIAGLRILIYPERYECHGMSFVICDAGQCRLRAKEVHPEFLACGTARFVADKIAD